MPRGLSYIETANRRPVGRAQATRKLTKKKSDSLKAFAATYEDRIPVHIEDKTIGEKQRHRRRKANHYEGIRCRRNRRKKLAILVNDGNKGMKPLNWKVTLRIRASGLIQRTRAKSRLCRR